MKRSALLWTATVTLLSICFFYLVLSRHPQISGSTFNRRESGAKAAYLFLRDSGLLTTRREQSWLYGLPSDGLLVAMEPLDQPTAEEMVSLKSWVSRGGVVLFLGSEPWKRWPIGGSRVFGTSVPQDLVPLSTSGIMRGIRSLRFAAPWRCKGPFKGGTPLVLTRDKYGAVLLELGYGKGRVYMAADPVFLANATLKESSDNGLFLLNLARVLNRRRVEFDEYHLGAGYTPGVLDRSKTPVILGFIWVQFLLLLGFYLVTASRRFGRPEALPETGGRTITEYISSMATLYQRAQAGDVALEHLYQGLVERMRLLTGLSSAADAGTLARVASQRTGVDEKELSVLLAQCQAALARTDPAGSAMDRRRLSSSELVRLAKQIDRYRKEFER